MTENQSMDDMHAAMDARARDEAYALRADAMCVRSALAQAKEADTTARELREQSEHADAVRRDRWATYYAAHKAFMQTSLGDLFDEHAMNPWEIPKPPRVNRWRRLLTASNLRTAILSMTVGVSGMTMASSGNAAISDGATLTFLVSLIALGLDIAFAWPPLSRKQP